MLKILGYIPPVFTPLPDSLTAAEQSAEQLQPRHYEDEVINGLPSYHPSEIEFEK